MAAPEADWIWMDGRLVPWHDARVHVLTHALHYGTGVLEGTRAYPTPDGPAVFRLDEHLRRLRDSAHILGIPMPYTTAELRQATLDLVRANGHPECYLRHVVHLGHGGMGPMIRPDSPVGVFIAGWEWDAYLGGESATRGVRLGTSSWRRNDPNTLPPAAKATAGYLNATLAKTAALESGYDEALMLSPDGYVSECSAANVFLVRDGVLSTPPPSASALRGITQDTVLTLAADLGIPHRVENLLRSDVYTADEAFLCGTAVEVVPVHSLDERVIGDGVPGPVTRAVQDAYAAAVTGRDPRHAHWLTPVPKD